VPGGETRVNQVYRAIADPTRRRILELLSHREAPVGDLTARFRMTQPALSQHLRVLREAGLVRVRRQGRLRVYSLDAAPLREVHDWLGSYLISPTGRATPAG
jgi:DNA-binding transcriptional ArsR family regulator